MGQTSPAQKALNQRMAELIRVAVRNAPSVTAVAAAAGIPRTTLQNIISETNERPVTVDQAARLAVALGVPAAEWMDQLRALAIELGATAATRDDLAARRNQRPPAAQKTAARRPRKKD